MNIKLEHKKGKGEEEEANSYCLIKDNDGSHSSNSTKKILVVGSGGIGCEIIKDLALSGFNDIHLVDLDTIELSNLNRQFLFDKNDIGKSKSIVASESIRQIAPKCSITPYMANIKDLSLFPISFYESFDIIMNALDNIDARKHVNRMALMTNKPLIESGTEGFLGQSMVIIPGRTECFECQPKNDNSKKTFPVCTIRTRPSEHVHCVIWVKEYLFPLLFTETTDNYSQILSNQESNDNDDNDKSKDDNENDNDNDNGINSSQDDDEKTNQDQNDNINDPLIPPSPFPSKTSDNFVNELFDKIFNLDITHIISSWNSESTRPIAIKLPFKENDNDNSKENESENENIQFDKMDDHEVWSLSIWISLFKDSCKRLLNRSLLTSVIVFDKDDEDCLDFASATSNIRATNFHIPMKSKFDIKAMAGNIIPSVSTTNAIVASICSIQATNVLRDDIKNCANIFVLFGSSDRVFTRENLSPPNPECPICSTIRLLLRANPESFKLKDLIEEVLPSLWKNEELNFTSHDEITIFDGDRLIYDVDFTDNENKTLEELSIINGKIIRIEFSNENNDQIDGEGNILLGIIDDEEFNDEEFSLDIIFIPQCFTKCEMENKGKRQKLSDSLESSFSFLNSSKVDDKKANQNDDKKENVVYSSNDDSVEIISSDQDGDDDLEIINEIELKRKNE